MRNLRNVVALGPCGQRVDDVAQAQQRLIDLDPFFKALFCRLRLETMYVGGGGGGWRCVQSVSTCRLRREHVVVCGGAWVTVWAHVTCTMTQP